MLIIFFGVLVEFIVTTWFHWLTLERQGTKGIVDYWGPNWNLRILHHLNFARDGLGDNLLSWWVGVGMLLGVLLGGLACREIVRDH
jgi:hypothetical protein